jgi:hypothetical protein
MTTTSRINQFTQYYHDKWYAAEAKLAEATGNARVLWRQTADY